jgi:hypothetical protein
MLAADVAMTAARFICLALALVIVVGCDRETPPAAAASASATAQAAGSGDAEKTPISKLTGKELDDAYAAALEGKMLEPFDKKKAALIERLGQPTCTAGETLIWYGITPPGRVTPESCRELKMSPNGASEVGGVDIEKCYGRCSNGSAGAAPAPSAAPDAADYSQLTGNWVGSDWGQVKIDGRTGTYTDTYSGGFGKLEFTKTGEREYTAIWGESKQRHGTLKATLSEDGRKLTGSWTPDPDVTIGTRAGGSINWMKR